MEDLEYLISSDQIQFIPSVYYEEIIEMLNVNCNINYLNILSYMVITIPQFSLLIKLDHIQILLHKMEDQKYYEFIFDIILNMQKNKLKIMDQQ